jgi:hypothetical protein
MSTALEEARNFVIRINFGKLISRNEVYDSVKLAQYCEKANTFFTLTSYDECDHLTFMNFYLQYSHIPKLSLATTTKELFQQRDYEEEVRLKTILDLEDLTPLEMNTPIYKWGGIY